MEQSTKEDLKYQVKGEKAQDAGNEAGETPADKPKPRRNRKKAAQTEGGDAQPTPSGDGAGQADAAGEETQEKKPRQKRERKPKADAADGGEAETAGEKPATKYRVKGEKDEEEKGDRDGNASNQKDTAEGKKRTRNNKSKEEGKADGPAEPRYRVKGEKSDEPEEQPRKNKKGGDNEKGRANEEPERKKNLVYRNPMDFKEKKKFKSKWEEYHYGEWKRGSGKTYVTLETVIPEVPAKPIAPPDEANYRKRKQDIDDAISAINKGLEEKKTQFEEILGHKQAARSGAAVTEDEDGNKVVPKGQSLKELFSRINELQKQKKQIYAVQDKIGEKQAGFQREREALSRWIDKKVQKAKDIPKAIKECQKELETSSSSLVKERELIQRMKILKESIPHIEKRDVVEEKIDEQYKLKKESSRALPKILQEIKSLQTQIDAIKKGQEQKTDTLTTFDNQLNKISDKRKQDWDGKDKLRKQKDELNDEYYGSLINYSKYQYLLSDIKWMSDMQKMLKDKQAQKQKYEDEKRARKEKYEREKEERKKKEEEYTQKQEERKEKIAANKKAMEEGLRQTEIDALATIQSIIEDSDVGSNPMFGVIEQISFLQKLCNRKLAIPADEETKVEQAAEESKVQQKNELDQKLKKGAIVAAPTKEEKMAELAVALTKGKKGNKKQKKNQQENKNEGTLDFSTVKKFGALKLAPPLTTEEYERSLKELALLREAVIYWGKIQQRIRKVKFLRESRKIIHEEEYQNQCKEEEEFIDKEKSKYSGESTEGHEVDAEKLKVAQIIYRENTMRQAWNAEDDGDDYQSSDDDRGFGADDAGDEDAPLNEEEKPEGRERRQRPKRENKPKQTQRPNKESFKKIMGQAEAFPTLENDFEDDSSEEEAVEDNKDGEQEGDNAEGDQQ